ncbi:hypothetical protein RFI_36467, partial [Reticulomyxa filosa]
IADQSFDYIKKKNNNNVASLIALLTQVLKKCQEYLKQLTPNPSYHYDNPQQFRHMKNETVILGYNINAIKGINVKVISTMISSFIRYHTEIKMERMNNGNEDYQNDNYNSNDNPLSSEIQNNYKQKIRQQYCNSWNKQ